MRLRLIRSNGGLRCLKKEIFACPYHSGVDAEIEELCRRCNELNAANEKQWTSLKEVGDETKKKASSKTIMWGIGIMVVVLPAVLGVMWRGQDSLANKLSESENRITTIVCFKCCWVWCTRVLEFMVVKW